jgi:glutamyl/glutaminyl-tRNA synthetase
VIRFRVGDSVVAFDDVVRGRVEISTRDLGGDLIIVRSDGTPLYHFVVVVDDAEMKISHVIRGEDHISNTPKHVLLFRALGATVPIFAHLPLILNPDRTKMSKRKSQTAIADYRAQGFIPEGWSTSWPCSAGPAAPKRRSSRSTSWASVSSSSVSNRAAPSSTRSASSG